jgi:type I restriction enzyme S subunit
MRVLPDIAAKYQRTILKGGELLLTLVGTVGETAIVPPELAGWNTARAVAVIPVLPDPGAKWVQYALKTGPSKSFIDGRLNTTVQATLNLRDVAQLPIPMPSANVRAGIIETLSALDDKIELNRKMSETLEQMARAIFKSWFIDFDPVHAKRQGKKPFGMDDATAALFPDSFEQSEFGEIPSGWRYGTLSDISRFQSGYAFKSKDWVDYGVPVVKIGSVKPGVVDLSQVSYVTEEVAKSVAQFRLSVGDILIGMTGYVGEVGMVPPTDNLPLINQRVGRLTPLEDDAGQAFLYLTARHPTFKEAVEMRSHGTAQANVSGSEIMAVRNIVPPTGLRRAFNALCAPFIELILSNYAEAETLTDTRDLLLPRLISGELGIREATS